MKAASAAIPNASASFDAGLGNQRDNAFSSDTAGLLQVCAR